MALIPEPSGMATLLITARRGAFGCQGQIRRICLTQTGLYIYGALLSRETARTVVFGDCVSRAVTADLRI